MVDWTKWRETIRIDDWKDGIDKNTSTLMRDLPPELFSPEAVRSRGNRQNARAALTRFECGDWFALADRVDGDDELLPEERALAAAIIRGKFKRPRNRMPSRKTAERNFQLADRALLLVAAGEVRKNAVTKVANDAKVSASHVSAQITKWQEELEATDDELSEMYQKILAKKVKSSASSK
jgi:hypothetical protein